MVGVHSGALVVKAIIRLVLVTMALASGWAHAQDFKSVAASAAVLQDAPSEKGRKVFIAPPGMPVEIVLTYGEWTKVRDVSGDLAWVPASALSAQRMLVVTSNVATVRSAPHAAATPVYSVVRHVVLELAEPSTSDWLKVRHRDGQGGYVNASEVWGH